MSVQVRRRREAAAFLQSFVGAQGELLVDTTNNRVQVHDGATPNGWPAAGIGDLPGRNALVNGAFAVNQRGAASGTALAANAYAHDRWKAGAGGCTYTFTQTVPDTTITITAGTLIQAVDAPNLYATAYWLTWLGTATARVWQGSASGAYSAGTKTPVGGITVNALLVTGLTLGTIADVEFSAGTLGLVQFEAALPNAGPTRFERRHAEIVLCKRYFQLLGGNDQYEVFGPGVVYNASLALAKVDMVSMRAAPSVVFAAASAFQFFTTSVFQLSAISLSSATINTLIVNLTPSGSPVPGNGLLLRANQTTAGTMSLSAEL